MDKWKLSPADGNKYFSTPASLTLTSKFGEVPSIRTVIGPPIEQVNVAKLVCRVLSRSPAKGTLLIPCIVKV
jgi:hypothetical protein